MAVPDGAGVSLATSVLTRLRAPAANQQCEDLVLEPGPDHEISQKDHNPP